MECWLIWLSMEWCFLNSAERLVKVIAVEPRHLVKLRADTYLVIQHQIDQAFTVDQHKPFDRQRELNRLGSEAGSSNEYTAFGFLPGQGAIKRLQVGAADGALPAFGLHVDLFQPQCVERDHAINAAVTTAADLLQRLTVRAVAQAVQHIKNDVLEARRARLQQIV